MTNCPTCGESWEARNLSDMLSGDGFHNCNACHERALEGCACPTCGETVTQVFWSRHLKDNICGTCAQAEEDWQNGPDAGPEDFAESVMGWR